MTQIERFIHLFLFETLALVMVISALFHYSNVPFLPVVTTLIAISATAMVWHYIFNLVFDRYHLAPRETRSWSTRIQFTFWFKATLLIFTTPIIALVLQVNLKDAFVLDCVLTLFSMGYTLIFHYCYDHCRLHFISPTKKTQLS